MGESGLVLNKLTPYAYQEADIDKILLAEGNAIIATQVGGGKTLVAVEVALRTNSKSVLIIAPKGTHERGWAKTIKRQSPNAQVMQLNSTYIGRKNLDKLARGEEGWYLISPEYFRRFGWQGIKPDIAIFDEAHRASNRKSKTSVMLNTLKAKRRIAMSGTIAGNSVDGFWSIIKWVYPEVAGRSYWNWVDKYCETENQYFGGKTVIGEKVAGMITESIPCYIRHLKREACCEYHPTGMDSSLPPVDEVVRVVELSSPQKGLYQRLEKDMVAWLGENPLVVELPISMRVRLRQITLGMPTVSEAGEVSFADDCKSSKIEELLQIISDHPKGEQMLVLTHSQKFAKVVTKRLIMNGFSAVEWSGAITQDVRNKSLTAFVANEVQFIVAVISAIGEGTDGLQEAASTVVWLSRDDNNIMNEQASGRLDRQGQTRRVVSYDIVANNTYDEGQLSTLVRTRLAMNASLRKEQTVAVNGL